MGVAPNNTQKESSRSPAPAISGANRSLDERTFNWTDRCHIEAYAPSPRQLNGLA